MSYCRFSSDNFQSDVYAYDGHEGIVILVARSRFVSEHALPALPDRFWAVSAVELTNLLDQRQQWLEQAQRVPIGGPLDGAEFVEASAQDALDRLKQIEQAGYRVPAAAKALLASEVAP